MSRSIARWVGVTLAIFTLVLPIQAQNVLTVRVESFEALLDDVDTIAVALGQPKGSAENWLAMAQGMLGMPQFDWIDRKNPVVLALPLEGMMLGQNGFVGALPVADIDRLIRRQERFRQRNPRFFRADQRLRFFNIVVNRRSHE